jgi:hypothetical protein
LFITAVCPCAGFVSVFTDISIFPVNPLKEMTAVPQLRAMLAMRNLLRDLKSNLLDNATFRKELERIGFVSVFTDISIFPVNPLKEMTAVYFPARALISARNSLE